MTKRVIITGASSGIGWATALELALQRYELVLIARREERLRELAQLCRDRGATRVDVIVADLSAVEGCRAAIDEAAAGNVVPPLVLVNCAGIASFGGFHETPLEEIEAQMQINLLGPMYLCASILEHVLPLEQGQIINVGSVASIHVFSESVVYSVSKAGLRWLSKTLAAEYRARGVRVTSLIVGSTDTPLWQDKDWKPDAADMLAPQAVAEAIRDLIAAPPDRAVDEIVLMPPKGIL